MFTPEAATAFTGPVTLSSRTGATRHVHWFWKPMRGPHYHRNTRVDLKLAQPPFMGFPPRRCTMRLMIEIAKRADGAGVLACTRADGSQTWQKQKIATAAHFALHDLTHYAVETTLGYKRGFFGLIAEGWEIEDTSGKGARGRLPDEAVEVETIVGLFDRERGGSGLLWTAEEFAAYSPRPLTEEQLRAVRELRQRLFSQWSEVAVGAKLELTFDLPPDY